MSEFAISEATHQIMAGFDGVWARVTGTAAPAAFREEDALQSFIRNELCACAFDSSLARMFQSSGRALLQNHAAAAKLRARRLRGEYFIRTGVSFSPRDGCQPVAGKLASLRSAMERDAATALAYAAAAEKTAAPELRELYTGFAAETKAAAAEARGLILDCF